MRRWMVLAGIFLLAGCAVRNDAGKIGAAGAAPDEIDADRLAHEILIVDGHIDLPWRLGNSNEDVSQGTESGHFDYPRARKGGLDAPFLAIFTPPSFEESGGAKQKADELIDLVEQLAADLPDKFALATTAAEIEAVFASGKIAFPMGMENGSPLEGSLDNLRHFHERGVRYITLSHAEDNHICDANFDDRRTWGGLSPFGREVVAEMNRLGMMIDVSHSSEQAFWQVMELSRAPVLASHSGCRHFTPGWERNLSDEMIRRLAESGGLIQINFGSMFLNNEVRLASMDTWQHFSQYEEEHDVDWSDPSFQDYRRRYREEHPIDPIGVDQLADHIDHVVSLVGIDHVGLGSDYDGVNALPVGLEDVSGYPNLIAELLRRGHSREAVRKICSGNLLRVMREVEHVSRELQAERAPEQDG